MGKEKFLRVWNVGYGFEIEIDTWDVDENGVFHKPKNLETMERHRSSMENIDTVLAYNLEEVQALIKNKIIQEFSDFKPIITSFEIFKFVIESKITIFNKNII